MNTNKIYKHILFLLLAILFVLMPILSLDAGISGDEEVHKKQAEKVIDYYKSLGKDQNAINTPITNLQYYGQSFDNITTLLAQIFKVEDIYTFRHICNSFVGWLIILFTALLAIHLKGYRTAIFSVILLAVSPRFMGHTYNNLKDIPFALGYISSIYFILKASADLKQIRLKYALGLILSMAFILSIRPGGLLVFCYFILFAGITLLVQHNRGLFKKEILWPTFKNMAFILISAYFVGLLFWPFALENPITNPFISMKMMSNYPVILRQLFEGKVYWSDQLPWYYLLKYASITIPVIVLPLLLWFVVILIHKGSFLVKNKLTNIGRLSVSQEAFILFTILFPFGYTIIANSNVYGGWRHLLFVYPLMVTVASLALNHLLSLRQSVIIKLTILQIFIGSLVLPLKFILTNHPIEYTYFNKLAGDYASIANRYEIDYYYHSVRDASLWLNKHLKSESKDTVIIASNYGTNNYFVKSSKNIQLKYVPYYSRGNKQWDYGIFYRTTIAPTQTSQNLWPPVGTIHSINVEEVPICAIVRRLTYSDYLGKQAYEKGDYEKALTLLTHAIQIDPCNEIAWINLGKTQLKLNNFEKANNAFKQGLGIIPNYEPSLFYLAKTALLQHDYIKAEAYYKNIIKNNKKSFYTYIAYAKLLKKQNRHDMALEILEDCLQINPGYKEAARLKIEYEK